MILYLSLDCVVFPSGKSMFAHRIGEVWWLEAR